MNQIITNKEHIQEMQSKVQKLKQKKNDSVMGQEPTSTYTVTAPFLIVGGYNSA